jgi:hypothetical protein
MLFFLVWILSISTSFAGGLSQSVWEVMRSHTNSWNTGGVCRHAAAEASMKAIELGLEFRIPIFSVDGKENHVIFFAKEHDTWYAIDSIPIVDSHIPVHIELSSYEPQKYIKKLSAFSNRDLHLYIEDASESDIECWLAEEECREDLLREIDYQIDRIRQIKYQIQTWLNGVEGIISRAKIRERQQEFEAESEGVRRDFGY